MNEDSLHPPFYRPRVDIGGVDMAFVIGQYRFLFCSKKLQSLGAIRYWHLLVALDAGDTDILYVTAETNDREGDAVIYLGEFTPRHHATITTSPALAHQEFFLPVACQVAREALGLPYEQFPLTAMEDACIAEIPAVLGEHFPQGLPDEETQVLMNKLKQGVMTSPV
jgi:hypothetical protein